MVPRPSSRFPRTLKHAHESPLRMINHPLRSLRNDKDDPTSSTATTWPTRASVSSRRPRPSSIASEDAGVLVTLLLNHVVLAPGEAMFIPAGMIHAYTSGFGVEVMAASDNVLRAGLMTKQPIWCSIQC